MTNVSKIILYHSQPLDYVSSNADGVLGYMCPTLTLRSLQCETSRAGAGVATLGIVTLVTTLSRPITAFIHIYHQQN